VTILLSRVKGTQNGEEIKNLNERNWFFHNHMQCSWYFFPTTKNGWRDILILQLSGI
jgi:hypothetical protein